MTDYRQVDRDQQINIERSLMTAGIFNQYSEDIEMGNRCAICLQPSDRCICSEYDEDE